MAPTRSRGLRVAVTGAAGFIGRAVVERIEQGMLDPLGPIGELRLNDVQAIPHSTATLVTGSYADSAVRERLVGAGVDILFHLASLPGGAAQRDPALGRAVNLDGSMALIDAVSRPDGPIVVYASSIAALGAGTDPVNDATPLRPVGGYGTHKAMIELYLAEVTARGLIDGRAVRPAGIVARPRDAYGGFATAWMSDLFHAAVERRPVTVPARPEAHVWLQSVNGAAENIVLAALLSPAGLARHRAWTLPATVVRLDALVDALSRRCGHPVPVTFGGGPLDHPPLDATASLALGFFTDGDTDALVDKVVSHIERG